MSGRRKIRVLTVILIVLFAIGLSGCKNKTEEILQMPVAEKIPEAEEEDENALVEEIENQLEIFAGAKDDWMVAEDDLPYDLSYAVFDFDRDGLLELITSVNMGTGLFSENHFYQVNPSADGIVELPQKYYSEGEYTGEEFDISFAEGLEAVYQDKTSGIFYYTASDISKNGYAENFMTDGVLYKEKDCIYSMDLRGCHSLLQEEEWQSTYYDTDGTEISEEAWEELLTDFYEDKEASTVKIGWKYIRAEEISGITETEMLRELKDSYQIFK